MSMTWGLVWRTGTMCFVMGLLAYYVAERQWANVSALVVRFAFFYMLWLIIQYVQRIIQQGQEAFQLLVQSDKNRTLALDALTASVKRNEERQKQIEDRQVTLAADVAANTAKATKQVEHTLESIKQKLDENTHLTGKAMDLTNGVHETIASTGDDIVAKLEKLFQSAQPKRRA